ncbi:MAG: hypothetical protein EWV76_18230 [Microcystis novacekii Mn_MB_F_20050700_S1]|uniref:Uncharacterized protein n=1 Tax=Microcystis novacekii Mn_MB_F_20050700_S1D TaxID=2486266 RepID=A0A552J1X3_9CHRO|nr:MAG: hypothetical protein EWV76_18230 [Microcystis novacekii Mn_MB_F_20050700_S1]TRU89747.1 MAG: hypothetical protein EWV54_08005 [Microcystis novacekii Mn_MB_F_20050700_S1D]
MSKSQSSVISYQLSDVTRCATKNDRIRVGFQRILYFPTSPLPTPPLITDYCLLDGYAVPLATLKKAPISPLLTIDC